MAFLNDLFFWVSASMAALLASSQVVGTRNLGRHPLFGLVVVAAFALGRVVLALPSLPRPRFEAAGWHWALAGAMFALGVAFSKSVVARHWD